MSLGSYASGRIRRDFSFSSFRIESRAGQSTAAEVEGIFVYHSTTAAATRIRTDRADRDVPIQERPPLLPPRHTPPPTHPLPPSLPCFLAALCSSIPRA